MRAADAGDPSQPRARAAKGRKNTKQLVCSTQLKGRVDKLESRINTPSRPRNVPESNIHFAIGRIRICHTQLLGPDRKSGHYLDIFGYRSCQAAVLSGNTATVLSRQATGCWKIISESYERLLLNAN